MIKGALPDERLESIEGTSPTARTAAANSTASPEAGSFQDDFSAGATSKKTAQMTQVLDRVKSQFSSGHPLPRLGEQ